MGKNTLGKFLATPFMLIAMPCLVIGLCFRFGTEKSLDILEGFTKVLKENK
jgi:hypothetical protein